MTRPDDRRVVTVPLWAMQDCAGDARDAMVLAQITWWMQPAQRSGAPRTHHLVERDGFTWMYLTDAELAEEVGMSDRQVRRARSSLVTLGLIATKSAKVAGRKQTLIRPTIEHDLDSPTSADSAPPTSADSQSDHIGESRAGAVPLQNHEGEPGGGTPSSTDVDRCVPDEEQFEAFWTVYPQRNGKRLGKRLSRGLFLRLPLAERRAAWRGAANYAAAVHADVTIAQDPERFLKHRRWEDWQEPAKLPPGKMSMQDRAKDLARTLDDMGVGRDG